MSITRASGAARLRHLLVTPSLAARAPTALTLHAPSVIVVSSTLKPLRTRDEAHAHLLFTLPHASERLARSPTRYRLQSIAL
jgi:hypothetical protein